MKNHAHQRGLEPEEILSQYTLRDIVSDTGSPRCPSIPGKLEVTVHVTMWHLPQPFWSAYLGHANQYAERCANPHASIAHAHFTCIQSSCLILISHTNTRSKVRPVVVCFERLQKNRHVLGPIIALGRNAPIRLAPLPERREPTGLVPVHYRQDTCPAVPGRGDDDVTPMQVAVCEGDGPVIGERVAIGIRRQAFPLQVEGQSHVGKVIQEGRDGWERSGGGSCREQDI